MLLQALIDISLIVNQGRRRVFLDLLDAVTAEGEI